MGTSGGGVVSEKLKKISLAIFFPLEIEYLPASGALATRLALHFRYSPTTSRPPC